LGSNVNWTFISQLGSGSPAELNSAGTTAPGAAFSCIAPPSPPSFVAMGSYCLKNDRSAGSGHSLYRQTLGQAAAGAIGFMFRPDTNPTTGIHLLHGFDDGSLNGKAVGWRGSDLAIVTMDYLNNVELVTSAIADTAEVYEGKTNPWYVLLLRWDKAGGRYGLQVWKEDSNSSTFNLIDEEWGTLTSVGTSSYARTGNLAGSADGKSVIGNIRELGGGGYWGPVVVNMATGVPITKVTNSTLTVKGDTGADDTTTGAGDTEYPYINERPPTDTSASYLKQTSGITQTQRYTQTASLVPASTNVLAVAVCGRYHTDNIANLFNTSMRIGISTKSAGAQALSTTGVWCHQTVTTSFKPGGTTGFNNGSGDTDTVEAVHTFTRLGGELRVSQMILTVAYGDDEAANSNRPYSQVV
jgi:hypothetical protein